MNIKQHMWKGVFGLVLIVIGGGLYFAGNGEAPVDTNTPSATSSQAVETITIGETSTTQSITTYGEVVSVSQVDIYPEIQGVVERVQVSVGSTVRAGQTLFVLDNDSQEQELASAQAALASAEARYEQVADGADAVQIANLESSVQSARAGVDQAQSNLESTIDSVLATVNDSLQNNLDANFFTNGTNNNAQLSILADPLSDRYPLDAARVELQDRLETAESSATHADTKAVLGQYQILVDDLIAHVSDFNESKMNEATQDEYLNILRAITQTISAQSSSLASSQSAYKQARETLTTAENNLDDALEGADNQELAIARSDVSQAQARVSSAQLALNRTSITAPVAGTISKTDTRVGALVGPNVPVATISNESALRVDTSVSTADATRIEIGDAVRINNAINARVSAISPSVDTTTGEVELQAVVTDANANLVSGMGVELSIAPQEQDEEIQIPISAVFVRNETPYAYEVVDGVATTRAIEVDNLYGEYVTVTGGLEAGVTIIARARGIDDGEAITTQE
jgi:RND family efflux transporter MFP subunit